MSNSVLMRAELEARMREYEVFRDVRLPTKAWTVVRLDGRDFTKFTEKRFEKPFDEHFRALMVRAAHAAIEELQGIYCYTFADEVSVLLHPDWDRYGRQVERLASAAASAASVAFTTACGEPAYFEASLWAAPADTAVLEYFRWRQAECARSALGSWCYWTLRRDGLAHGEVEDRLRGKRSAARVEFLASRGISVAELPGWQRRGIGLFWEEQERRPGATPADPSASRIRRPGSSGDTTALRRIVREERNLPTAEAYQEMLRSLMTTGKPG